MIHETDIEKLKPGLSPFPKNIFDDAQPWLADHLLPLLSIDLGLVKPELAGTIVHMVCPIEPYEGYIGENSGEFHNEFTAANWFALQLTEDNRYRFLGQQNYFCAPAGDYEKKYAAQMKESHQKAAAYFEQHGRLASFSLYGKGEPIEGSWLANLGGPIWYGNWTGHPDAPGAFQLSYDEVQDQVELSYQGHPFFLVADVAGYNYCASGADSILMFYEPKNRIVLFSFDWS